MTDQLITTATTSFSLLAKPLQSDQVLKKRPSGVEWIALLLLGASALGALAYGFSELFHLFNSCA